ncbi:isoprenylcysteine carboxylmethyltransferase family protein [Exilibacterium tricleocarpae]|uniref:Isoprenylcysteine carboxylmethyltransferase family protein n=1 Tax=Exilibacterium tricleocarpae TaxID=2591008 RepID=A0A545TLY7_9GAMM|nr:isoprenylcysteine carboxylmethyltransferase family protein [Exilibacterium tricleocarpae]TQV78257.1 isoprenylcysteine carboxylmethyltransferase family protein [Exilibacterium tricleocarpae]
MKARELKIPPLLLVVLFTVAMWAVSLATPNFDVAPAIRYAGAVFFTLPGVVFCLYGVLHFRQAKTTVNPLTPDSATALVSSGVYRISRNPMYLGFLCLLLAWATLLANLFALLLALLFAPYMNRFQILPEERALQSLFGADYNAYRQQVRRWL